MSNKIVTGLSLAFLWLLMFACASRIPPSGGPRDDKSPTLIGASPENNTVFFNSKKIILEFDEFIDLKAGGTKILIAPIPDIKPKFTLKRKSLWIEFKDTLAPNETYVISLDNSIADITEGNLVKDLRYVFSTGSYIDSLMLTGMCKDAFTGALLKDVTVMLYRSDEDSLPFKEMPRYFARTDEQGMFTIYNIKEGNYKLFALADGNDNYLFDNPSEKVAFLPDLISIRDSLVRLKEPLLLFKNPLPKQRIVKKTFKHPGLVNLGFAKPVDSLSVVVLHPENFQPIRFQYHRDRDSLDIWFPEVKDDSLKVILSFNDGMTKDDTVKFNTRRTSLKAGGKGARSSQTDTILKLRHPLAGGRFSPYDSLFFESPQPIRAVDASRTKLIKGEDTSFVNLLIKELDYRIFVPLSLKEDEEWKIIFLPGAVIDIYGQSNDTLNLQFKVLGERDFGAFEFQLKSDSLEKQNLVIQLYQKDQVLKSIPYMINQRIKFDKLKPGAYNIRLIMDENQNRRWDAGNYFEKRQPEEILSYPQVINIRAGWDTENIWEFDKGASGTG
ncbi:MAG: Ig-like domain-containing domain, partial [Flavobacteriales bacterium]